MSSSGNYPIDLDEPSSGSSSESSEPEQSGLYRSGSIVLRDYERAPFLGNRGTTIVTLPPPPCSFREIFLANYPRIRHLGRSRAEVGLAAFAIDTETGRLAGSMALGGEPGRLIAAVVGRHSFADLRLSADPSLANRQLAVLVHPVRSWEPDRLRYSVLDLRTHRPMVAESGAPLASAVVEGPFFARLGRYALLVLPTGDPSDFPDRAEDAWEQLPERVLLDRRAPPPPRIRLVGGSAAVPAGGPAAVPESGRRRHSTITRIAPLMGPEQALLRPGESSVGRLVLSSANVHVAHTVGPRALRRGVLLGRDPRCDASGVLGSTLISRAHLLLKEIDGRIYGVDLASTNGSGHLRVDFGSPAQACFRVVDLGRGAALHLGHAVELHWSLS